jgi:hypothetical protein
MRFFCYNEPIWGAEDDLDENGFRKILGNEVVVKSEDDICRDYYPYWKVQMEKKYGVEEAKRRFCFDDCLDDWIVVNMAWESHD